MKAMFALAAATAALGLTTPALAAGPDKQQGHHAGKAKKAKKDAAWQQRDGRRADRVAGRRYGPDNCPPGLRWKNNGCVPPGLAKKRYNVGYRFGTGYQGYTPYDRIPEAYRREYGLDGSDRYIYRDGYIYQVDPTTRLVERVLSAIVR